MVGSQLCGVLESYANLLKTFEAAARRTSTGNLAAVGATAAANQGPGATWSGGRDSSPRLGARQNVVHQANVPAHPSPLGLASRRVAATQMQGDIPPLSLDGGASGGATAAPAMVGPQHARNAGGQSGLGPIRVVSPRLMQSHTDDVGSHQAGDTTPHATGLPTAHTRLPPLRLPGGSTSGGGGSSSSGSSAPAALPTPRTQPSPGGPSGMPPSLLTTASPTTQSKRALFDAVAEAAAAGTGIQGVVRAPPLAGFLPPQRPLGEAAPSQQAAPSTVAAAAAAALNGSPLRGSPSRLRPQNASSGPFALGQPEPGSPGLLRLAPAADGGSHKSGMLSSSPTGSMLRLDPFRASGAEAFLDSSAAGGGDTSRFAESPPSSARSVAWSTGDRGTAPGPPLALTPPVAPGSPRAALRGMKWSTSSDGRNSQPGSPARRSLADRLE